MDSSLALTLHIAEYEALMTRNTYHITLQFSLLPVAILIVSLCSVLWSKNYDYNRLIIWSVYAALLIVGTVWAESLWELYNNVFYMEQELKPQVHRDSGSATFWMYEQYLARVRKDGVMLWELALPAFSIILYGLVICLTWPFDARWPLPGWQYAACGITALENLRLFVRSRDAVRIRRAFTRFLKEPPK